jgi:hypothetical protein
MKNSIVLILVSLFSVANAQLNYKGLAHQKKNRQRPNIRLKSDTLFVPTMNGLFKKSIHSMDTNWLEAGFHGMDINDFVLIGPDTIICVIDSTEGNTVFISTDNGKSYYNSTNGAGGTGFTYFPITKINYNPFNHKDLLVQSGTCVARSRDFGKTWTNVYNTPNYEYITKMEFDPNHPYTVYATGGAFDARDSVRIFRSDDVGEIWGVWKTFLIPQEVDHPGIMVFKLVDNHLYLMFGNAAMFKLENEIGNVEAISMEPQIKIYPNPVVDILSLTHFYSMEINGSIYSMDGKLISNKIIQNSKVNVSDLAPGQYVLNFMFENKFHTYKFVKK